MLPSKCMWENLHHDLPSFFAYARRTGLNPASTVFVGNRFEYVALASLRRLGFSLKRTGGKLDKGIDLLGTWNLPSLSKDHALRVLVQCKALAAKVDPRCVRELEGAFVGVPATWKALHAAAEQSRHDKHVEEAKANGGNTMALLVTPSQATKGVRDAMGRSRWPMGFAKISLDGVIEQLLWNKKAADRGLEGVGVSTRYRGMDGARQSTSAGEGRIEQEIVLTWNDDIWEYRCEYEHSTVM